MNLVFSPQVRGVCSKCGSKLKLGGYMIIDDDNQASGILCHECKDIENELKVQKARVSVKQIPGIVFWVKHYLVTSSKNILFISPVLSDKQVQRLVLCKDIDVSIKYT